MLTFSHKGDNPFEVEKIKVKEVKIDYGESVVDKSQFRPNIDEVRLFEASMIGSNRVGLYDFEDGVDNGLRLTQLRNPGADITEINETKKKLNDIVDNQLENAKNKLDEEVKKAEQLAEQTKTDLKAEKKD